MRHKWNRQATIGAVLAVLCVLGFRWAILNPPWASAVGALGQGLLNGSFEGEFRPVGGVGELTVAEDWYPWYDESEGRHRPEYKPESRDIGRGRVYDGDYGQKLFTTYSTQDGGVYQSVETEPGHWYHFKCRVYIWSSNYNNPDSSRYNGKLAAMVGINPWGDANVLRRTTVWGKESVGVDGRLAYDQWVEVEVVAQAWSEQIVVATRSNAEYPVKHNDSYWDMCELWEFDLVPPTPEPCPACPACPPCTPPASATACPRLEDIQEVIRIELVEREPVQWPR